VNRRGTYDYSQSLKLDHDTCEFIRAYVKGTDVPDDVWARHLSQLPPEIRKIHDMRIPEQLAESVALLRERIAQEVFNAHFPSPIPLP